MSYMNIVTCTNKRCKKTFCADASSERYSAIGDEDIILCPHCMTEIKINENSKEVINKTK